MIAGKLVVNKRLKFDRVRQWEAVVGALHHSATSTTEKMNGGGGGGVTLSDVVRAHPPDDTSTKSIDSTKICRNFCADVVPIVEPNSRCPNKRQALPRIKMMHS